MNENKKQIDKLEKGCLIVAFELHKNDTPFIMLFTKQDGGAYIEHISYKDEGFFVLKDYRKESVVAKEIIAEVSRHVGGAWLIELCKKYGVEEKQ